MNDFNKVNDKLIIDISKGINYQKFFMLNWYGTADGTTLTRNYINQNIQKNYLRLIYLNLAFYTNANNFEREVARDSADFATNTNTRYSMLRPYTRIPIEFLNSMSNIEQNILISFDSNPFRLFPFRYTAFFDKYDLNLIYPSQLSDGIDMAVNANFIQEQETPTETNPFVIVQMAIEILNKLPDNFQ